MRLQFIGDDIFIQLLADIVLRFLSDFDDSLDFTRNVFFEQLLDLHSIPPLSTY